MRRFFQRLRSVRNENTNIVRGDNFLQTNKLNCLSTENWKQKLIMILKAIQQSLSLLEKKKNLTKGDN